MTQEQENLIKLTKDFLNDEHTQECKNKYEYSFKESENLCYSAIIGLEKWLKLFQEPSENAKLESKVEIEESTKQEIENIVEWLENADRITKTVKAALIDFGYSNLAGRLGEIPLDYPICALSEVLQRAKSQKSS